MLARYSSSNNFMTIAFSLESDKRWKIEFEKEKRG